MRVISIPAVYDGKHINLLETPPILRPYRVLVTFVAPVEKAETLARDSARFWASFGAWRDDRPLDATLRDIHDTRRSRAEPPEL